MKFSEQEIQPLWDEVARMIGEGVITLRHQARPLSTDALIDLLAQQLYATPDTQRRILLGAAINMLKDKSRVN
ncbi:MAG: hypothetical protein E6560_15820 [Yersiniaceae bacterium]|uniref:Uncharacterized protein n=1 Tax=Chimaeribacter coloradensis TaxID=2060068 RepID=A0A2N5ED35_9GAMM|nr:hypothetical protein [Chimaeribacter coloradensis]MDU6412418.1 hypothetical protein [Yersiniaceae bacterium]PLR40443.1 hypothetical protein CYR32_01485 [Chimaeribacter coloradensis]